MLAFGGPAYSASVRAGGAVSFGKHRPADSDLAQSPFHAFDDLYGRGAAADGRLAAILPMSGIASNGKPIKDWDGAAAQLTRSGSSWSSSLGQSVAVTYAFRSSATSTPDEVGGFQRFNEAQIIAAEASLELWSDVANITFVRVGSGTSGSDAYANNASILFSNYTMEFDDGQSAFAYLPSPGATASANVAGDIWVDLTQPENANPVFSDFGPHVLAHEIGHAIGLSHPSDYNGSGVSYGANAAYWQDSRMFTVMSYFGSMNAGGVLPTFSWGPQFHDIAAAQHLYGANMTTRTGDTIYGFNSTADRALFELTSGAEGRAFSIWDAGGNDTLDLSGYGEHAEIDLRPESFSSAGPTPDTGPAKYNISIARGVTIENAIGGSGNDKLIGNDAANVLEGRGGNDTLNGGVGADTLIGAAGADALNGGAGADTASYADAGSGVSFDLGTGAGSGDASGDAWNSIEIFIGTAFADTLAGGAGAETIDGADGADSLSGATGDDSLIGGLENDTLSGGGNDDTLVGAEGDDDLRGDAGRDSLVGGAGADLLLGFGSHDSLYGGDGDDDLRGGDGKDLLGGANGDDVARGFAGDDRLFGGGGADTLFGNDDNDSLTGGGGADRLKGDAGDDTLNGNFGADTVTGGDGDDVFEFRQSHGADIYDDFVAGAGSEDAIRLLAFGAAFDEFGEVIAAASQIGADTVIDFGGGDSITLIGVALVDLHEDDFIFG